MKNLSFYLTFLSILFLLGCDSSKKSDEIAYYQYTEKLPDEFNGEWQSIIGDWLEKGIECYGLVVAINAENVPQRGRPVKAKVLRISKKEIKMRALEDVSMAPIEGCSNLAIMEGETWKEKEAELFQTKEEAIVYLQNNGLYMDN